MMRKCLLLLLGLTVLFFGKVETSYSAFINFEDNTSEHLLTNEYQSLGVLFSGEGVFSGRVLSIPSYGVGFFGNDGPWVMHIGNRNEPTTATFVIPGTVTPAVSTNFSVLMGDGNPDLETFTVTFFDLSGTQLDSETHTTGTAGVLIAYPGPVASIEFLLEPASGSGVVLDNFAFTSSAPVPEPSTIILIGTGLIGLLGVRRKLGK